MARQNLTVFLSSPSFHHLIPPSPGEATHYFFFLPRLLTLIWGGARGKSLAWVWAWCRESTSETEERKRRTGKTATDRKVSKSWIFVRLSRLPYTLFLPPLHLCVVHSAFFSFLHFYISLHLLAQFPLPSLSPSLPAHSALLVCCNGP